MLDTLECDDLEALVASAEEKEIFTKDDTLSSNASPYTLSLRRTEFVDEKEMGRFIKSCEFLIRRSPEYNVWTEYIRETLGFTDCQVTGEQHAHTKVDIHHHPFTLFDIVKGVVCKHLSNAVPFCSYDISEEVIGMHYKLQVPYCLLVRSIHEKYHNGYIRLPMEIVRGECSHYLDNYLKYLDGDECENITYKLGINKGNCGWENTYRWSLTNGNDTPGIEA